MTSADAASSHHDGPSPRTWIIVGFALVVLAAVAYVVWPRRPEHVLIVGDSVTYMTAPDLDAEFSGTKTEILAYPGDRSTDLLPITVKAIDERARAGKDLDRAIFLVGYNDVWMGQPDTRDLDRLVEASARYRCAIWLTIPARPGGKPPVVTNFDPAGADHWNQRMADLVGKHDNLHLVTEWAETIEGAPAARYLEPDDIHPNRKGTETLARIMHDNLISKCRFAR